MVMVGAAAIAIVIILVVMMRNPGKDENENSDVQKPAVTQPDGNKTSPDSSPPKGRPRTGGTPDRAAPALTNETFTRLDEILADAKKHYNEGVTRRNAGDNTGAREAQAKAKTLLDQWENLIRGALDWQEEADMDDWAQPAEYEILTRKYTSFSSLQKMVRMGGGK